ncbi:hypothetical protein ACH5RR_016101 [Cinchona calisaya]|uniref:Uncharacterized protein n=1 Tax=Cinchona calisaya TaxID=153742 RepID=A0ABD2ZXQ2_9GENT
MNAVALAKTNWWIHSEENSFGLKPLKRNTSPRTVLLLLQQSSLRIGASSQSKHSLKSGIKLFNEGSTWLIRSSLSINLWHDNWTFSGPLRNHIQGFVNFEEDWLVVANIFVGLLIGTSHVSPLTYVLRLSNWSLLPLNPSSPMTRTLCP